MESAHAHDPAKLPLTELRGVGPTRAERLGRLGLSTVRDLLLFVPRGLERQGGRVTVAEARESVGLELSVRGRVRGPRLFHGGRRRSTTVADLEDETGKLRVNFFQQPWMFKRLRELAEADEPIELYGRIVETKSGPALAAPRMVTEAKPLPKPGTIVPVYPLTEGIGQEFLRALAKSAAASLADRMRESLPEGSLEELQLPTLTEAVQRLHSPASEAEFLAARRRLALERLIVIQALFARSRRSNRRARAARLAPEALDEILEGLPHSPTEGQRRVIREIASDLARTRPMRRLLLGDVGSGKTLCGLAALAVVSAGDGQAALLAPTEILAAQHFRSLSGWLGANGLPAVLLSGSLPTAERREALHLAESGSARVVIGTHALFSERVRFRRLDLVVVDEQQRFGVDQKRLLLAKGDDVHLLLMTATPIPRTLALSIWGDLEVSRLDDKPPGRGELRTHVVGPQKRERMLRFLAERMQAGERVFWVCPRIETEAQDQSDVANASRAFDELRRTALARHGIELVHGRVAPEERAARLARFRTGVARLLVGTSIVEVGVDVPEATVMVVEGAERFGLAQLHQLRGRVGRGPRPSWCLLLGSGPALERLRVLEGTSDGFEIARADLERRGMGDLAGDRQAGKNVEGLEDPVADLALVRFARALVDADPELAQRYLDSDARGEPALV